MSALVQDMTLSNLQFPELTFRYVTLKIQTLLKKLLNSINSYARFKLFNYIIITLI
jgi:hypothetical protein